MTDNYKNYLQSDAWKQKATARMKLDNYTCQMCGSHGSSMNPLVVHHMHYRTLGHESVERDLVTVCSLCHKQIHMLMNRPTGRNQDGTIRHGWKDNMKPGQYGVISTDEQQKEGIKL